jgi:KEOPS complex subunit Cgi121
MLQPVEEFGKLIGISGFRRVTVKNVEDLLEAASTRRKDVDVQFFDARLVATWQHLYFAVLNALTAFRNKENISKKLSMEIMLYASAQGQIKKATQLLGIKKTSSEVAVLVVGENAEVVRTAITEVTSSIGGVLDESVLEISRKKARIIREAFGITREELQTVIRENGRDQALVDLVIERMALLAAQH